MRDQWMRIGAALLLASAGLFLIQDFLYSLAWALVVAIATWPLRDKLAAFKPTVAPWLLTLAVGALVLGPVSFVLVKLSHEVQTLAHLAADARNTGLAPPAWLGNLPSVGDRALQQWQATLGSADTMKQALHGVDLGLLAGYTRTLAEQVLHRAFSVFIMLLALFFLFQDGAPAAAKLMRRMDANFGPHGARYAAHAVAAVKATVNGLVLVGLGEGLLLGIGYAVAGVPHPVALGAVTAVMAMIPFAAKLVFGGAALVLVAQGQSAAAAGLFAFGLAVLLLGDNYLRPRLIGGSVRIPFLWTLLGLFGGIQHFGILGLFLGPALMALLLALWRDWTTGDTAESPAAA